MGFRSAQREEMVGMLVRYYIWAGKPEARQDPYRHAEHAIHIVGKVGAYVAWLCFRLREGSSDELQRDGGVVKEDPRR